MTSDHAEPSVLPAVGLVLAMFLWASSFVAMKVALWAYDPLVVVFCRMLLASLAFLLLAKRFRRSVRYVPGDWKYLGLMALFEPCLYYLFEAHALTLTTASQAGMVTALLPLMCVAAACLLLGERHGPRAWIGLAISLSGAVWLSVSGKPEAGAPNPMLGNFLEFLSMVCAAGYVIAVKRLTARYPVLFLTAVQAVVGCLFFLPSLFMPFTELPDQLALLPTLCVVWLGLGVTIGAYGLFNFAMSRMEAGRASVYVNLIPVFTVAMGWLFLGETFTPVQYVASVLILLGVFVSGRAGRKAPPLAGEESVEPEEYN